MFKVMFFVVPIFILLVFVLVIAMFISPKFRGKMMSRQFKSMRYMLEDSKDDLAKMGSTGVEIKKQILDENEETLTDIAEKEANINSIGIKSAAKAVKDGLMDVDEIHCKHCGEKIDSDSKFCKICGKEQ